MNISGYEFQGNMRPYAHQEHIIKFMLANKKAYIWADMGTGKTASSLWFLDILMNAGHIKKALIIAPLSTLRSVWADEVKKVCPHLKYEIVHGSRPERLESLKREAQVYITNTDCVRTYKDELIALRPDVVIVDEVTSFANASSKRSKCLQALTKSAKSVFGLSGNPTAGGILQSYGIAKAINPEKLPTTYFTRYRDMILSQVNMYEYIPRPGALKIVNRTLSPAIKFSLEECIDLPPIIFETRMVELPKPTMDLFKEILKHQIAEYKEGLITAQTAGVKAIRLIQILTGFTKTVEGEIIPTDINSKLMELIDLYHEAGNKLVIFAQSVHTVKIIKQFLLSKKIHTELIYGEVALSQRERIIKEFQTRLDGVLVAQVKTMSHGITLTKSHTIVFFGPVAGNETYRQAIRRIRRIGQTHKQTVVRLLSTKFEEQIFKKLDETEFTAKEMLDMYKGGMNEFL